MGGRIPLIPSVSQSPLVVENLGSVIDPTGDLGGFAYFPPLGNRGAPELAPQGVLTPPAGFPQTHARLPITWSDAGYTDLPPFTGKADFPSPLSGKPDEITANPSFFRQDWRRPKLVGPSDRLPGR